MADLDIVIPVYNEGQNIQRVLDALGAHVETSFRVLICYDDNDDDTLPVIGSYMPQAFEIEAVRNAGEGAFGAVVTGFRASRAMAVLMLPADDDYNAPRIDTLVQQLRSGCEIVAPSRFIQGGRMVGCPPLKAFLVRTSAFLLHHLARLPVTDPSNGFRLFSRRVIESIPLESTKGFAFSIELLVKAHRLGWTIREVPVQWFERRAGRSRFRVLRWLPEYIRWFLYAFATTWLHRGPNTVTLRRAA